MSISSFAIQSNFNVKNAMASNTLSELVRVRKETIRDCLSDFENEEHRLERVLHIHGVKYINDSKATNLNAVYYALESMTAGTVWIARSDDKEENYQMLLPLVNEKVKAIICLGQNNDKLIGTFANVVDFMIEIESLEDAVKIAYRLSEAGDTVLFSPSCEGSSGDSAYQDGGDRFKRAVKHL